MSGDVISKRCSIVNHPFRRVPLDLGNHMGACENVVYQIIVGLLGYEKIYDLPTMIADGHVA